MNTVTVSLKLFRQTDVFLVADIFSGAHNEMD